ncbi:MAG TPA: hypothetical protein VMS98_14190 [Thermoanaerobaculia bacterium]|nr:hypothetical protein [Thermoanaerobaculia bacterium]
MRTARSLLRLRRGARKHFAALSALVVYHLVVFLPALVTSRVLSANDIYYALLPWKAMRSVIPANGLFADSATSWWTLAVLAHAEPATFHWNPYIASGAPGFGTWTLGLLSPFVLPAVLLPLTWFYAVIVLLKLNTAFALSYMWLREERMGKAPASIGALVMGAAGVYVCWWLWPMTNAVPLYGGLLWLIARAVRRKRVKFRWILLLAIGFATAGYPATVAYAFYAAVSLLAFLALARRWVPSLRFLARSAAAVVLALALMAPFIASSVRLLQDSGYLQSRENVSFEFDAYPLSHLAGLILPYRLMDDIGWVGDPALRGINNLFESTLYIGKLSALLALAGLLRKGAASRWFWVLFLAIVLLAALAVPAVMTAVGSLPGIRFTPLTRLRFLLPVPVAYLAAAGCALVLGWLRRFPAAEGVRRLLQLVLPLALAAELGIFARAVLPFIDADLAKVGSTPALTFLKAQPRPFRIAAVGDWLGPNTSELVRLEDVRSHFSSEAAYRAMLERIDPGSYGSTGTLILFDGGRIRLDDSAWSFLNVRYLVDSAPPELRLRITSSLVPLRAQSGQRLLGPGGTLKARLPLSHAAPAFAVVAAATPAARARLVVRGHDGTVIERREVDESGASQPYSYIRNASNAAEVELTVTSGSVSTMVDHTGSLLLYASASPFVPVARFIDGEVFENLAVRPRYFPLWDLTSGPAAVTDRSIDLTTTALIGSADDAIRRKAAGIAPEQRRARLHLRSYAADRHELVADSPAGFFLMSSEKLTPDLRIECDGRALDPVRANAVFAGVWVPAGRHLVTFERRLGRGWWWLSAAALLAMAIVFAAGRRRR